VSRPIDRLDFAACPAELLRDDLGVMRDEIIKMQRTIDRQADQILALAIILFEHNDIIRQDDLDDFKPRNEGGAA
jgi:hypothetical protein